MRLALKLLAGVALSIASGSAALGQDNDEAMVRDLSAVQQSLYQLQPARADRMVVRSSVDRSNGLYAPGDKVQLSVRTNVDAYVTVVSVGASGAVTVLFPNAIAHDNHVRAGQMLNLPTLGWNLRVSGPQGIEVIKIFASTSPKAIYANGRYQPAGPFMAFDGPGSDAAQAISAALDADSDLAWGSDTRLIRVGEAPAAAQAGPATLPAGDEDAAVDVLAGLPRRSAFGLAVQVDGDGPAYRIGQSLRVRVRSETSCRLTLLNIGAGGRATVLFPNRLQREATIPAGETVILPSASSPISYQVGGPVGREDLVAVCTADRLGFVPATWNWADGAFHVWSGGREAVGRDLLAMVATVEREVAYTAAAYIVIP